MQNKLAKILFSTRLTAILFIVFAAAMATGTILDRNMDTSDFNFIFLGQSVLKYQVPLDVYNTINHIYETKYPELKPANKQLVGKIEKEHSLFFNGEDNDKMTRHNHLPQHVLQWFASKFRHYLEWNKKFFSSRS